MNFKTYLFNLFPQYFNNLDTYKDGDGKGVFQRYTEVFGVELDEQLVNFIDNFATNIIDLEKTDIKFLPLIAGVLGFPPSIDPQNPELYRRLLMYIVSMYKVKGTKQAYEILFGLIDYKVTIIESIPRKKVKYDTQRLYDQDPHEQYDIDCDYCSDFWLSVSPKNFDILELTDADYLIYQSTTLANIALMENLIPFLQPINTKYRGMRLLALTGDAINLDLLDNVQIL